MANPDMYVEIGDNFDDFIKRLERVQKFLANLANDASDDYNDMAKASEASANRQIQSVRKIRSEYLDVYNEISKKAIKPDFGITAQTPRGMSQRELKNVGERVQATQAARQQAQAIDEIVRKQKARALVASDLLQLETRVALEKRQTARAAAEVAREAEAARKAQRSMVNDAPSLRYALYDVSNNFRRIALGAAALAAAPIGFGIKYERDFANVIRTNELFGDQIDTLRNQLLDIAQQTPISWGDVTNIAALAGQLGVAQESVAEFTSTVAKFAATTDLSVQASATALGRLDQLVSTVNGQFNNLASAILAVGVDSVATESAIVNVSTNIASMGNLAGLTAADIVGLSGAIASLGIRPELARGNVTRLFSNINKAIATSGRELEEYGRLTNRTAAEFADAWSSEPTELLLDFFQGIQNEGSRAERTLRDLGITSVRDIPAILRLAQSQDEVRRLVQLSNDEYLIGNKVQEQYSVISSTLAEQLRRLVQNFEGLAASIGELTTPLSVVIGFINVLVEGLADLNRFSLGAFTVGQALGTIGGIVAIGTALFVGFIATLASTIAGIIGLRFAVRQLGTDFDVAFVKSLAFGKGLTRLAIQAGVATNTIRAFSIAVRGLGIAGLVIGAVTTAAAIGVQFLGDKSKDAAEDVQTFFGDISGFADAVAKDTEKFKETGDAIASFTVGVSENVDEQLAAARSAQKYIDSQGEITASVDGATEAIQRQTLAIGESAEQFVAQAFQRQSGLQELFGTAAGQRVFESVGGDLNELIKQSLQGAGVEYVQGLIDSLTARRREVQQALLDIGLTSETTEEQRRLREELDAINNSLRLYKEELIPAAATTEALVGETIEAAESTEYWNKSLNETSQVISLTDEKVRLLLDSLFGQVNATKRTRDALRDLGQEYFELGDSAVTAEGSIQDVVASILEGATGPEQQIANLAQVMNLLAQEGLLTSGIMAILEAAIEGVRIESQMAQGEVDKIILSAGFLGNVDVSGFFEGLAGIEERAGGAAARVETLAEKMDDLVTSMFEVINLTRDTEDAIFALGEAFGESGDEALYASDEMQDAISAILQQSQTAEEGVANLAALFSQLGDVVGGQSAASLSQLRQAISLVAAEFGIAEAQVQQFIATAGGDLATINFENFTRGVRNAREEVRTLLDYASDLSSVIDRAFDIRFANTFAIDQIADAWDDLGQKVEDARYQVDELLASQQDLGADRALKEYFLSVAEAYNDTLRAAQLRKEITDLDRQQARNARELAEAQQIAGGTLVGQGPGIRQNRGALLDLVRGYQDYITTLAESGATQEELIAATEKARAEFTKQAIELGFQEDIVLQYAQAFDDVTLAINRVPRNITVNADTNPAIQALNELNSKLDQSIQKARDLNAALNQPSPAPSSTSGTLTPTEIRDSVIAQANTAELQTARRDVASWQSRIIGLERSFGPRGTSIPSVQRELDFAKRQLQISKEELAAIEAKDFASGGYTGAGGKYQPAGIVHRGEYVVPSQYVNQSSGLPNAQFLASLQNGVRSYANGGFVGGGMSPGDAMMVELSPYDRKLLENAGNVQLRVDGKVVASATNRSNFNEARRGSN